MNFQNVSNRASPGSQHHQSSAWPSTSTPWNSDFSWGHLCPTHAPETRQTWGQGKRIVLPEALGSPKTLPPPASFFVCSKTFQDTWIWLLSARSANQLASLQQQVEAWLSSLALPLVGSRGQNRQSSGTWGYLPAISFLEIEGGKFIRDPKM